jgi:hypothetical protein
VNAEWFEEQCAALPAHARYQDSGLYRRPCADDVDIRVEYLDRLDSSAREELPDVIVWPPRGARSVPPAFFIEEPDPLPDRDVSGYPVSIQFNPNKSGQLAVQGFRLFELVGETRVPVENVRLLDRESDPNQLLSTYEFALFPLQRLAWDATYEAVVDAEVEGRPQQYSWRFGTQGQGLDLLTAERPWQRFVVRPGVDFLLYLPPQAGSAYTVLSTRTEHLSGNSVALEAVDPNTLRVRIEARYCDRIKVQFDDDRVVELVPAGCEG